jgi:hypothetical protein
MPINDSMTQKRVDALARSALGRVLHGTDKMRTLVHGTIVPALEFTKGTGFAEAKPRNTVKTARKSTMAIPGVLPLRRYTEKQYRAWLLHRRNSGNFDVFSGGLD